MDKYYLHPYSIWNLWSSSKNNDFILKKYRWGMFTGSCERCLLKHADKAIDKWNDDGKPDKFVYGFNDQSYDDIKNACGDDLSRSLIDRLAGDIIQRHVKTFYITPEFLC